MLLDSFLIRCSCTIRQFDLKISNRQIVESGNATFITASDQGAQERLFRQALRDAHLAPDDISYVEMHGTGTPVGDPVEMGAVASVLGRRGVVEEPLTVGAIKANVGHSEAVRFQTPRFKYNDFNTSNSRHLVWHL